MGSMNRDIAERAPRPGASPGIGWFPGAMKSRCSQELRCIASKGLLKIFFSSSGFLQNLSGSAGTGQAKNNQVLRRHGGAIGEFQPDRQQSIRRGATAGIGGAGYLRGFGGLNPCHVQRADFPGLADNLFHRHRML